jgi:phosphoglycolate phosphatase
MQPYRTRLVVFDLDGTLVDSQATIVACAQAAFVAQGEPPPAAEAIRRIVGLSLAQAMADLLGRMDHILVPRLVESYREAFFAHRQRPGFDEPLFPGVLEVLEQLAARETLMGIATGKAMRGLQAVLSRHRLEDYFVTLQTADLHPSKPDPSMLLAAMAEAGAGPQETVLVGDTSYDMLMAQAANTAAVGVAWGNHPGHELLACGAHKILESFDDLLPWLEAP